MSIEHKLLICAADLDPDKHRIEQIRGYMSSGIDVDSLIGLAEREGLEGFLYKSLSRAGALETLKPRYRQKLHDTYFRTIRRNLKLIDALKLVLGTLDKNRVEIVLIQGIALLLQVYQDVGLRPLKDIDLWVLPDNYENLVHFLISQGFERDLQYPNTFKKSEVLLDVHTRILWVDHLWYRDNSFEKRQIQIFAATEEIHFEGNKTLGLSSQDQFLHLGLHALKGNLKRLLWLVEIKNIVKGWKDADWKALKVRAEELGHQRKLFYMLYILNNIFNLTLPPEILYDLESWQPNIVEKRILGMRISGHPIPSWARLILLSADRGLRERVSFFMQMWLRGPDLSIAVFQNNQRQKLQPVHWKRFLKILGLRQVSSSVR